MIGVQIRLVVTILPAKNKTCTTVHVLFKLNLFLPK